MFRVCPARSSTYVILVIISFIFADFLSDGKWLPMVRRLMLPIHYILNQGGYVESLLLTHRTPFLTASDDIDFKSKKFGFKGVESSDNIFDALVTQ